MDFAYSEEQSLLRSSVERFVADRYAFHTRREIVGSPEGMSLEIWNGFAKLGLLGIPFEEKDGGLGQGAIEVMIVMEAFGRGIVVEPYLETVVLAGALLRHGASASQRAALVPGICSGERKYCFAFAEPQGRFNPADLKTTARPGPTGFSSARAPRGDSGTRRAWASSMCPPGRRACRCEAM